MCVYVSVGGGVCVAYMTPWRACSAWGYGSFCCVSPLQNEEVRCFRLKDLLYNPLGAPIAARMYSPFAVAKTVGLSPQGFAVAASLLPNDYLMPPAWVARAVEERWADDMKLGRKWYGHVCVCVCVDARCAVRVSVYVFVRVRARVQCVCLRVCVCACLCAHARSCVLVYIALLF